MASAYYNCECDVIQTGSRISSFPDTDEIAHTTHIEQLDFEPKSRPGRTIGKASQAANTEQIEVTYYNETRHSDDVCTCDVTHSGNTLQEPPSQLWTQYDAYHGANYTVAMPTTGLASIALNYREHHSGETLPGEHSGTEEDEDENGERVPLQMWERSHPGGRLMEPSSALIRLIRPSLLPAWKLNYQDFSPEFSWCQDGQVTCTDTFSDLVRRANDWLRQNPELLVKSCETIEWTKTSQIHLADTETVSLDRCRSTQWRQTFHTTALRLWLVPNTEYQTDTRLYHHPDNQPPLDNHSHNVNSFRAINFRDFQSKEKDRLSEFLTTVNSQLETEWIQGDVLCMNSVFIPEVLGLDPQKLLWKGSDVKNGRSRMYLRVFYTEGPPVKETIGIKDMVPDQCGDSWDSFSSLMKSATTWIRQDRSHYVTNLQSIYVDRKNYDAKESAELCCQSFRNFNSQQCFQVLRFYYFQKCDAPHLNVINCMTFTPVQTTLGPNTEAEFERMKQTMSRISAWLELAGAVIRSAETFITPVTSSSPNHTLPEKTFWTPSMYSNTHKYLMHIRVYLEGDFSEPDPRLLPPLPYSLTEALQTSIQEREYNKYYKQKKVRQKRKRITVIVFLVLLLVAVGFILLDQLFDIFRRLS